MQAVIFDVDGVLVDSFAAHYRTWRMLADEFGADFDEPTFAATFGITAPDIIRRYWPGPLSDEQIAQMSEHKEALYRQLLTDDFPAMDGARELVESLHAAGFKLAVGSSGPPENVALPLAQLGCGDCFDATVNGNDVARGKPDPQVSQIAAERLGVEAPHCAVIEDAPVGIAAANAAANAAIALTGTATGDRLTAANLIVNSLRDLTPPRIAEAINAKTA